MVSSFQVGIYPVLINEEQACNNRQLEGKDLFPILYDPFHTRSASLTSTDGILSSHWIYFVSVVEAKYSWVCCMKKICKTAENVLALTS